MEHQRTLQEILYSQSDDNPNPNQSTNTQGFQQDYGSMPMPSSNFFKQSYGFPPQQPQPGSMPPPNFFQQGFGYPPHTQSPVFTTPSPVFVSPDSQSSGTSTPTPFSTPTSSSSRKRKGKRVASGSKIVHKWSTEEEQALTRAYLHVSTNPIIGKIKQNKTFGSASTSIIVRKLIMFMGKRRTT